MYIKNRFIGSCLSGPRAISQHFWKWGGKFQMIWMHPTIDKHTEQPTTLHRYLIIPFHNERKIVTAPPSPPSWIFLLNPPPPTPIWHTAYHSFPCWTFSSMYALTNKKIDSYLGNKIRICFPGDSFRCHSVTWVPNGSCQVRSLPSVLLRSETPYTQKTMKTTSSLVRETADNIYCKPSALQN